MTLSGTPASTLPLVCLVAEVDGLVVGFIEVGLRSHADGCRLATRWASSKGGMSSRSTGVVPLANR